MAARVRASIEIDADVSDVFAFLDDPRHAIELLPDLIEITDVERLANGGHRVRFTSVGRGGRVCEWESETIERVPNELVVTRAATDRLTTIGRRELRELDGGTRLDGVVEYAVQMPLAALPLKPVTEFQMRRPMRRGLQALLARIKARVESQRRRA